MVLALALSGASGPVLAVDWTLGLGAGYEPDYEGSDHYRPVPLWNVKATNLFGPTTYTQLFATRLISNLLNDPNWRLGVAAQYVEDYDHVDDDKVEDLKGVDSSLLLGAVGGYDWNLGPGEVLGIALEARADVLHGNGYVITLGPKYQVPFGNNEWLLNASLNGSYASKDYMDNYFTVSQSDAAAAGFDDTHDADAGLKDVTASLGLTYAIDSRWSVSGLGLYRQMVGDAKDSPVVDEVGDDQQWFGGVLVNYSF
jgi:outer membrane scaffolding protein for murein synthesis (MipA/OmpV family)